MIAFLVLAAIFLAYFNGANDNFKGVAALYGSGITTYRRALGWATLTTGAGSLVALGVAGLLLRKFTGKGLVPEGLTESPDFPKHAKVLENFKSCALLVGELGLAQWSGLLWISPQSEVFPP